MKAAILTTVLTCVPAIVVAQQTGTPPTPPQNKPPVSAQAGVTAQTSASAGMATDRTIDVFRGEPREDRRCVPGREDEESARCADARANRRGTGERRDRGAGRRGGAGRPDSIGGVADGADQRRSRATGCERDRGWSCRRWNAARAAIRWKRLVKHAPAGRSLAVAFNVLAKLEANGEPVDGALAKVAAKLDAGATDDAVASLAGGLSGVLGAKKP